MKPSPRDSKPERTRTVGQKGGNAIGGKASTPGNTGQAKNHGMKPRSLSGRGGGSNGRPMRAGGSSNSSGGVPGGTKSYKPGG